MTSLRKRIIRPVILLIAAVGFGAAATSFVLVMFEIDKFLDTQLQETAINFGTGTGDSLDLSQGTEDEDRLIVRVWDQGGTLVRSAGPPADLRRPTQSGFSDIDLGGERWRIYRLRNGQQDVAVAQSGSARREIAARAAMGAAFPLVLVIPLAWLLIGWSVNKTLQGLQSLSQDLGRRSVDARGALALEDAPEEIASLVVAIEGLLARQSSALESQRRFVADAAHELRTPLAALQIQTDNLMAAALHETTRELVDELGSGVRRVSRLADQLLELARIEGASVRVREEVELLAVITTTLPTYISLAETKDIELAIDAERSLKVENDPNAIQKLIGVLLENAIRYSPQGSLIEIVLDTVEDYPRINVVDEGPGISTDALPFIYDRFFRAEPSGSDGNGLGLAIARTAAERNGIRLSHQNRTDRSGIIAILEFYETEALRPHSHVSV
jgi:two-component system OmpR family sensor kinase